MHQKVYVTGMGAVCCLGSGVEEFWAALCEGKNGLGPIQRFDLEKIPYVTGGEVKGFSPVSFEQCALSMGAQFALESASMALRDFPPERRGSLAIILSTNFGPAGVIERKFAGDLSPDVVPAYRLGTGLFAEDARRVAKALGAGGPLANISLSCASANAAISHALDLIRSGRTEAALACGYDSIQRMSWAGLSALRVMVLPDEGSDALVRPFDRDRAGTIFSEGAGCLLLESARHAEEHGAAPLAEVVGAAANNNAYHITHADKEGRGSAAVIRMALNDGGISPDEVDHINAHGTGTKLNDAVETRAFLSVFGERAAKIPVVSLKGGLGHAMGAASALEAVASVMTLLEGKIPPTVNYETPDPDCALDVVHAAPRDAAVTTVLNNSAGIGGANAAVVLRRPAGSRDAEQEG